MFKNYNQNQQFLLPPSLDEMIPEDHMVRVVNKTIDEMDITTILATYKGGGTTSYHPRMMLKVIVYAYSQKIYSSRRIAKSLREDINFMWLSGMNKPDFRTINNFRSSRLKGILDKVFSSLVALLVQEGFIKFENYFLDGTKLESTANRYTFVWKKSVQKHKDHLQDNIRKLIRQIDEYNEQENREYGDRDLAELGENSNVTPEKIKQVVDEINEKLKKDPNNKFLKKASKKIRDDYLPRAEKYEKYEKTLGNRNSFSKTDEDATFMRMKEDHMRNGQLKPGYNVQMGTENQFIVSYSVHQNPGDSLLLKPHLEGLKQKIGRLPANIIADAGYGSEQNYDYLEQEGIENFVKYSNFHFQQKRSFKKKIFKVENLDYDKTKDEYTCPFEKKLKYRDTITKNNRSGYSITYDYYESEDCTDCPHHDQCHKGKGNRVIQVSKNLNRHRKKARDNLTSDQGLELRSRRPIEVESVFGQIKHNRGFRRFMLKGLANVNTEWGLLSLAHNIKKILVQKKLDPILAV